MNLRHLLVALNAKYSHTSLGVRSIAAYAESKGFRLPFMEASINDRYRHLLTDILEYDPDVIGFSCYIWNIELIKELSADIKAIRPKAVIILGGPEAFYNENILNEAPWVDYIIQGEGERPYAELLEGADFDNIRGVKSRIGNNGVALPLPLDEIPFVYSDRELSELKNKAVYYETSRGCPYSCSFCVSALTDGVRVLPIERILKELSVFMRLGIKRVKLVDRTFNFDRDRAYEIFSHIINSESDTCFHFEIAAELFDESTISLLKTAGKGQIQFEAGIQTTNAEALRLCQRVCNLPMLKRNVRRIVKTGLQLHLDLIAGLPSEGYTSFKNSFNEAYSLGADVLQLGFLKLLHSSKLRSMKAEYGYVFQTKAPYEVLQSNSISFQELNMLKKAEEALEIYHNSGIFKETLSSLFKDGVTYVIEPYDFFYKLGARIYGKNLSLRDKFLYLYNVLKELDAGGEICEKCKLDYVKKQRGALPEFFTDYKTKEIIRQGYAYLSRERSIPNAQKRIDLEVFLFNGEYKVLAFDRGRNTIEELFLLPKS